jgi:OmpA-OmpF porin, OOP family
MKKHLSLLSLSFLSYSASFTQAPTTKNPAILEVHYFGSDFKTRSILSGNMDPGLGITFIKGFRKGLDWMFTTDGSFPDSATKGKTDGQKNFLLEIQAALRAYVQVKPLPLHFFVSAGPGVSTYAGNVDVFLAPGAGVQANWKSIYFLANIQYRAALTDGLNSHTFYSFGIGSVLSRQRNKPVPRQVITPPTITRPRDSDGDGIYDSTDACPDVPGLAAFAGCPDSDGDKIADKDDQCPTVAGVLRYKGCPPPDRDGDGINDEEDACPDLAGFVKYKGCPIPDTDGDKINDEEDRCITVPGVRENFGCPPIELALVEQFNKAARNLFFKTGSYELLPASFKSLDEVLELLKKHAALHLSIEGHTDNVGKPHANELLSKQRAGAVLDYLKSKGIDAARLQANGFGDTKPIAENNTSKGRASNRRVEFKLMYKF